jgi:plastocyanin
VKRTASLAASLIVAVAASLSAQARPAAPAAQRAAAPASKAGAITRVRMVQNGTHYTFEPATLTVKQGDIVEFVNVSGGPHNVSFEPTKIPAGAADVLNRAMPNRMGPVSGPMLTAANQAYRVNFAGAPTGTYEFFCLPHKAMGMKGTITVQAAGGAPARR